MKTTTINLELTTDELFDIAYALEEYVKNAVKYRHVKTVQYVLDIECKSETDLLQHFINHHGYTLTVYPKLFGGTKEFFYVDDWLKYLMKDELKSRKEKEKLEVV